MKRPGQIFYVFEGVWFSDWWRIGPRAGLLKQLWMLVAGKQGVWANWMRQRYLRRKDIWEVKLKNESSWVYKGIFSVRNEAKSAIRSLGGTGCDVDLLHFPWLPQGPILDRYDFLFLKLQVGPKAQSIRCLLRVIPGIFLPLPLKTWIGRPIWTLEASGDFSFRSAWRAFS